MSQRYAIWNKQDTIYTPSGRNFTAEEWISKYGWMQNPSAVPVCAAGTFNGGFCGELKQMKLMCEQQGATFDKGLTYQGVLDAIEAFEDALNHPADTGESSPEERIAAALEYANVSKMPVVNTEDPDTL